MPLVATKKKAVPQSPKRKAKADKPVSEKRTKAASPGRVKSQQTKQTPTQKKSAAQKTSRRGK